MRLRKEVMLACADFQIRGLRVSTATGRHHGMNKSFSESAKWQISSVSPLVIMIKSSQMS